MLTTLGGPSVPCSEPTNSSVLKNSFNLSSQYPAVLHLTSVERAVSANRHGGQLDLSRRPQRGRGCPAKATTREETPHKSETS